MISTQDLQWVKYLAPAAEMIWDQTLKVRLVADIRARIKQSTVLRAVILSQEPLLESQSREWQMLSSVIMNVAKMLKTLHHV